MKPVFKIRSAQEIHIYEKLPVPFAIFQLEGDDIRLQIVSDGLCKLFRIDRSRLEMPLAQLLKERLHPEDVPKVCEDLKNASRQPMGEYKAVYRLEPPDGSHIFVSVHGYRENQAGEACEFFSYFSDITAEMQQKAELEQARQKEQRVHILELQNHEMKHVEQLWESKELYKNTVDSLQIAIWTYDIAQRRIVLGTNDASEALRKRFGWPRVFENAPESTLEFIEEQDREKYLAAFREIAAGRDAVCDVWYRQRLGIEPYCAREIYHTICDANGTPLLAYGISHNVTAEKKVEERYQREIGYLRQTNENNLVAKGHYNLTQNRVLAYSTKNDSIFPIDLNGSVDDAVQAFLQLPYDDADRAIIADKMDRKNLIQRYRHGDMQTKLTYRHLREGDLPIWMSLHIHTYMMPETGDLECFTYAYDITEKMLNDSIMDTIANAAFDYIGLIFSRSDQFECLKKSPQIPFPETRQKVSYSERCDYVRRQFIAPDELAQHTSVVSIENILAGLQAGKGHHIVTYRRSENGRILCKQLDYLWFDQKSGIILVIRSDVTAVFDREQKQLAEIKAAKLEADRANEAKSAFLSSMSHDLRTPLNGVLGFTNFALSEPDVRKKQEYLNKIKSSGQLLLDLINDTLELSRIESGKLVPEPEALPPHTLLPSIITALRPSAELRHIQLVTDFPTMDTQAMWCDRLKMQKIALNLIANAIKYTPEGGTVSVQLKALPTKVPDCRYSLIVEDNGIGMSKDFLQHLYEPFSQEKRSETFGIVGTGLGLAIVKRYVDLLGGTILVESQLHKGTRFIVSLPIPKVSTGQASQKKNQERKANLKGMHVLLCEDNVLNAEIAVMLLQSKGIQVDTAGNGQEGLEKFAAAPEGYYDAILMDIRMPIMDGLEASKRIRSLCRQDARAIPIIAMTADVFQESIQEAKAAQINDYLTKPIDPEKLYRTLADQRKPE